MRAVRWCKAGDHPDVLPFGKRDSGLPDRGWLPCDGGGYLVRVGDWLVTDEHDNTTVCSPEIFDKTYEAM